MNKKLQWGIIGTGAIAKRFATGLLESETGELAAIGSRSEEAARAFSNKHPAKCHGSYESLIADDSVEAIYIATPHPAHAQWAIKAAEAGKHILCEKPLTMSSEEANAVIDAARKNDVFLMEAFMYRCHPQTARLVELLRSKRVGDIRFISATFSFDAGYHLESRLFDPALGGGGILDVGCYCASMARLVAGVTKGKDFEEPIEVTGVGAIGSESGVDEYAIASLKFEGGILAQLACGVRLDLGASVRIVGSEGNILLPDPWTINGTPGFSKLLLFKQGIPEEIIVEEPRDVYAIEADHVARHIAQRQTPAMNWADSIGNAKVMDLWRAAVR